MSERRKILWLVSWYPNKYDSFDGDFIQRHARAAALYHDIHVLFVKQAAQQKNTEETITSGKGLTEQIIYLPKKEWLVGKWSNFRNWRTHYKQQISTIIKNEKPYLVHVHVPWRAGLMALWAKKKYKISFVITEHWGIYNRQVEDNIHTRPFWMRYLLKKIFAEASGFMSVSRYVGEGVKKTVVHRDFVVIPNVVDAALFTPSENKYKQFTFLHVSNMVPLKNVPGIVDAFTNFQKQTGADAQLVLVGNDANLSSTTRLHSGYNIHFRGEVAYQSVAEEMQRSHVFVLNSNIENSPCVIGEAACCGLPVIATAVGGVPELVNESNGILVPPNDTAALTAAMVQAWQNVHTWNAASISKEAKQKYAAPSIGEAFARFYATH